MCQSQADGGLRCATATRPAFEALIGNAAAEHPNALLARLDDDVEPVIAYAATASGETAIREQMDQLEAAYKAKIDVAPNSTRMDLYYGAMDVNTALSRAIADGRNRRLAAAEVRRIVRAHKAANPVADTSAITMDTPVIGTVTDLSQGGVALWDRIEDRMVVEHVDCSYCGGKDVPLVDTNEGRKPVPHRVNDRNSTCQWGDTIGAATIANTLRGSL
jgi:hypothetical protein